MSSYGVCRTASILKVHSLDIRQHPLWTDSPAAVGRASLSGEQCQRLAISRLKKPRLRQTTCFVVAHRLSTIARVERIIVLEDGNIAESGTYRQLVGFSDTCFEVVHERLTGIIVQVSKEGWRFRHLVAAQLKAVAGGTRLRLFLQQLSRRSARVYGKLESTGKPGYDDASPQEPDQSCHSAMTNVAMPYAVHLV